MKHPNGNAYTGGRRNVLYCLPFGSFPVEVPWCYDEDVCISVYFHASYHTTFPLFQCSCLITRLLQSDEEVERLRCLFAVTAYSFAVFAPSLFLGYSFLARVFIFCREFDELHGPRRVPLEA
jgi:hypothetical protein